MYLPCISQVLRQIAELHDISGLREPEEFVWRMMQVDDALRERLKALHLLQFVLVPSLRLHLGGLSKVQAACDQVIRSTAAPAASIQHLPWPSTPTID